MHVCVYMTDSTESALHRHKSTKLKNSDFLVPIQLKPKSQIEFVPRDTEKYEFLDSVNFGDIALAMEPVICIPKSHESRGKKQRISVRMSQSREKKSGVSFVSHVTVKESCHGEGVMSVSMSHVTVNESCWKVTKTHTHAHINTCTARMTRYVSCVCVSVCACVSPPAPLHHYINR